jgi:8-hydroxy-5-deazaflavin:NADPH oxidoreductase
VTTVGIIGRGRMGLALTGALVAAGYDVLLAAGRPDAPADCPRWTIAPLELWSSAEIVVPAVPASAVLGLDPVHGGGRILVDLTNPGFDVRPLPPDAGASAGETLARRLTGWRVVKAFNTIPAALLCGPLAGRRAVRVPVAGDDAGAKVTVGRLVSRLGFRPVDAGGIVSSRYLERLAVHLHTAATR